MGFGKKIAGDDQCSADRHSDFTKVRPLAKYTQGCNNESAFAGPLGTLLLIVGAHVLEKIVISHFLAAERLPTVLTRQIHNR